MNNKVEFADILSKSDRVLFVTNLGIDSFIYAQNFFYKFSKNYENIKIDLFIDTLDKKDDLLLLNWLEGCSFINKIYFKPKSIFKFSKLKKELKLNNYKIITNLITKKEFYYLDFSRKISPKAFITAILPDIKRYQIIKKLKLKKANRIFFKDELFANRAVTDFDYYSNVFKNIFNLELNAQEKNAFIDIPKDWLIATKLNFLKWGINDKIRINRKVIFINVYDYKFKKTISISKIFEIINSLRSFDSFYNTVFVINADINLYKSYENVFKNLSEHNTFLFTLTHNFFQLASMIVLADLVICIDSQIMVISNAVKKPVISLLFKNKNVEQITDYLVEKISTTNY